MVQENGRHFNVHQEVGDPPPPTILISPDVAEGMRGKDPQAWAIFVTDNFSFLVRHATKKIVAQNGFPDNAQDAVVEALFNTWKKAPELDKDVNVAGYIVTAVTNTCINMHRGKKIGKEVPDSATTREDPNTGRITTIFNTLAQEGFENALVTARAIKEELPRLNQVQRETVVLSSEGLKMSEIADELQRPIGTVKGALSRARKKLEQALFEE